MTFLNLTAYIYFLLDPECLTGVGKLECPSIPNKASSRIVTHTSSLPTNPPSTRAAETKAVSAQSVITHTTTVSSEVTPTNLVSCVDVLNRTLFNSAQAIASGSSSTSYTVSSSGTAHLTQAVSSTHAASSTQNTTIQASQTVAVERSPTELLIPSTNKTFTTEISPDTPSISFMEGISLSTCVVITTKTVFSAVKSTESCKGCSSQSITFQLLNGKRTNLAQLSEKENISCNKGEYLTYFTTVV